MNNIKSFKQKLFQLSFCISLFTLSGLIFNNPLNAECSHHQCSDALELGIALETQYWTLVQDGKVEKFSKKLAHIFQGLNVSGIYTRKQQINGLAEATLTSFAINNPKATCCQNILVFSYDFVATGNGLTSGPSITVWKKIDRSWKIISHSYVPFID